MNDMSAQPGGGGGVRISATFGGADGYDRRIASEQSELAWQIVQRLPGCGQLMGNALALNPMMNLSVNPLMNMGGQPAAANG